MLPGTLNDVEIPDFHAGAADDMVVQCFFKSHGLLTDSYTKHSVGMNTFPV